MTCSIERRRAFQVPPIVPCRRGPTADGLRGFASLYESLGAYQGLKPGSWKGSTSLRPVLCGRSSPPRQIPSARAPDTSDVRTTLSVCVESAVRAAAAVLGAPPALSSSTALRKYHGGDTEDGRDNECSKHDFISVWSLVPKARRKLHPPVVSLVASFRFSRRLKSANRQHAPSNIIGRIERGFNFRFNHLFGARKQRRLLK